MAIIFDEVPNLLKRDKVTALIVDAAMYSILANE